MNLRRLLLALVLLALLGGGAAALATWRDAAPGIAGEYAVDVAGPGGVALFSGVVHVEEATALSVLLATGLRVETTDYPGMGAYVHAIEGHEAQGAAGWVYEVRRDGAWRSGDRSAGAHALQPGDGVRWSWTEG